MNEIMLSFTENETGKTAKFPLISKYSIITGLSGIGKTWFYDYVLSGNTDLVKIECELPVISVSSENINAIFSENNLMERSIIIVDEVVLRQYRISEKLINSSNHLLLSICRDIPFIGYAPLASIFHVKRENEWFRVSRLADEDGIKISSQMTDYDFIVTEAGLNRSEHELLSCWNNNPEVKIISAGNKDRIQKVLLDLNRRLDNPRILVLTDLSNFGMQYRLIAKRCKDNPNIVLYDYGSFEEMLFNSEFVKGSTNLDQFSYITLERFYEKALEDHTEGTQIEYRHGKKLSKCYLSECAACNSNCNFACEHKYEAIVGKDSGLLKVINTDRVVGTTRDFNFF